MARSNPASIGQDRAAGGLEKRLIRTKSGDVATVSVVLTGDPTSFRASLRFRSGGVMVTRPLGVIDAHTTQEALTVAWVRLRGPGNVVEANGWQWINQ